MLLLALDTSTSRTSVAVLALDPDAPAESRCRVVAEAIDRDGHPGERLAPMVDALVTTGGVSLPELTAVAVGLGPGPFTALRVGIVTAAAIADALGIPSYGCCSLDAIALAGHTGVPTLVVTDARRKQVYWARYDGSGERVDGPQIEEPAALMQHVGREVERIVGPGVATHRDAFQPAADPDAEAWPEPQSIGLIVAPKVFAAAPSDQLSPLYLRPPDARPPGPPKQVTPR